MRANAIVWFAAGFVVSTLVAGALELASAQEGARYRRAPQGEYVVAESMVNGQRVVGAVRHTARGPQVQLPGGSWVYCRRSCSETLRVETVDFWNARQGPAYSEKGLFGLNFERRW